MIKCEIAVIFPNVFIIFILLNYYFSSFNRIKHRVKRHKFIENTLKFILLLVLLKRLKMTAKPFIDFFEISISVTYRIVHIRDVQKEP